MPADGSAFTPLRPGKYNPDHPAVLAEIAEWGGDREGWEDSNVIDCDRCEDRFYVGLDADLSMFDAHIHETDGVFVCDPCAPGYIEDASYDLALEHGTYHACNGSVVG